MTEKPKMLVSHQHLPQQAGLTVPYITHQNQRTGLYQFGINDVDAAVRCIVGKLCGMCGRPLDDLKVLIAAEENFPTLSTPEPAMHTECVWYASRACPMLNGTMQHYGPATPADVGDMILTPGRGPRPIPKGMPAVAWYQIWVRGDYAVGIDARTMLPSWVVWKDLPELRRVKLREDAEAVGGGVIADGSETQEPGGGRRGTQGAAQRGPRDAARPDPAPR